ncbi:MAG: winged helix DNA-binding domain-containing protein [Candidatus Limnocylindrales bacterium]
MPHATPDVLSQRRLNRATLARQLLLAPADRDVVAAVEQIGGLQAQEPASPFIGLWARVRGFNAGDLDRALTARDVVKATLMRTTVHLVTAQDYRDLWPIVRPDRDTSRRTDRDRPPEPARFAALQAEIDAFTAGPRSLGELRDRVGTVDGMEPDEVVWWLRRRTPFVHVPAAVAWSFGRRPQVVHADAWLAARQWATVDEAAERLVRRYLAAFGPATMADIAAWSGVRVERLRPGLAAVEASGSLRRFRDERGRTLLDLDGAPLPAEDVSAPPRLLPMWDSTLLAFADRTRLISDADRAVVIARNGDTLATFTVDGLVAGLWWTEVDGGRTRIAIEPFRPIPRAAARALEHEGERLARFVEPLEANVYARFRRWRPRDPCRCDNRT